MAALYQINREDFYFRDEKEWTLECHPHMHYQIEFFYLEEGETTVYIDSVEYKVEAGDLCIAFPNQIHQFRTVKPERYMLFIINPDMLPEISEVFATRIPSSAVIRGADLPAGSADMLRRMGEIYTDKKDYTNVVLRGLLLAFFGDIFSVLSMTEAKPMATHALRDVLDYCDRNFSRDLSLSTLEEELHISKYYISHMFSDKLKVRFNDYLNSLRINSACRMLLTSDKTVTEISELVGFNTLRTFNRAFVRHMGISPSEYRRLGPTAKLAPLDYRIKDKKEKYDNSQENNFSRSWTHNCDCI